MNGWGIAALVFAAGCLAVAGWALLERYRYKGLYATAQHDSTICEVSRSRFKSSLEACQGELADTIIERDKIKLQLDEALRKPARTNRANSKAKQTEKEAL